MTHRGGVSPSSKTVKLGDNYGDLPTPTRSGYSFDGWQKSDGTTVTSTTQNTTIGDHTLAAKWIENTSYLSSNWADRIGRANLYNYTKELLFTKDPSQISGYSNSISVGTNSVTDTSAYVQSTTIDDVRAYYNDYSKIVFYSPCTIYAPEDSSWLFAPKYDLEPVKILRAIYRGQPQYETVYPWGLPSFTSMTFDNFNTYYVKDMSSMFRGSGIKVKITSWNPRTGIVNSWEWTDDTSYSQITSLDLSGFSTENVTNSQEMFRGQAKLTSLNCNKHFSSCTNMSYMFVNCSSLTSLNLGNFNLASCTNFDSMLSSCSALSSITLPYNLQSGYTISLPASTYYNGSAGPYGTIGTETSGTTVACSTSDTKVTLTKKE